MTEPYTLLQERRVIVKKVVVRPDSLAAMLVVNRELEEVAEAFRLQPHVNFVITFENYLEFIDKELNSGDYLSLPITALKRHIANYKNIKSTTSYAFLRRAFFKDLSLGVMKELFFAEKEKKGSSYITHVIEDMEDVGGEFIETLYEKHITEEMKIELIKRISKKRYPISFPISEKNVFAFKYALVLDYCANMGKTSWSFNK